MRCLLLAAALLLSLSPSLLADEVRELQQPLFSQPEFLLPGGKVSVQLLAGAPGKAVRAVLRESLTASPAPEVALDSPLITGMNAFFFTLPASAGPGLYDLCVGFVSAGKDAEDCQPHSVVVVKSFEPPFTVAQVTDYHVGDPRAEKAFPGVDIKKVRLAALERANQAKPAFILLTGDVNAYPKTYGEDYAASSRELIANAKAPLVILPGNHDLYVGSDADGGNKVDGASYWPRYFGPLHRVLDYGPFRFIGIDTYDWGVTPRIVSEEYHAKHGTAHTWQGTLSRSEYDWTMKALDGAAGRTPIIAAHHDPRNFEAHPERWCKDCVPPEKFVAALAKRKVPAYIYGHVHENQEYVEKGVRFLGTGSVGSDAPAKELWSIRLLRFNKDRTISSEVIRLFDSPPKK